MRALAAVMAIFRWPAPPRPRTRPTLQRPPRAAAQRLSKAGALLEAAEGARNRVRALTEAIRAYEDGLEAMREGLRRAAIREEALARELEGREDEIARSWACCRSIGTAPVQCCCCIRTGRWAPRDRA